MAKMKAAVITKAGSDFEIQGREIPEPEARQVRIRVHACGRRGGPRRSGMA
jgi:D-arabinose 1-dehydrogenase-like Zn-dependent alcohol dehydrogenase